MNISAVIITYNNESTIVKTLDSVKFADEIIIVDSGSTDETLNICSTYHCNIIKHPFNGYGEQKHFAVAQAKNNWVLVIDSDEVCPTETIHEIKKRIGNEVYIAYLVPISLVFMNKLLKYGGEYKKKHLRLFDKRHAQYNFNEVHEDVIVTHGKTGIINHHLLHYSYRNIEHYIEKLNNYTSFGAKYVKKNTYKTSIIFIYLRFVFDFIKLYIWRGLFLDGKPGLNWAFLSSFSTLIKYIKASEINIEK